VVWQAQEWQLFTRRLIERKMCVAKPETVLQHFVKCDSFPSGVLKGEPTGARREFNLVAVPLTRARRKERISGQQRPECCLDTVGGWAGAEEQRPGDTTARRATVCRRKSEARWW